MGTRGCVLECQTCDHKVAGSILGRGYFVLCTKVNSALCSVRGEMATLADRELWLRYEDDLISARQNLKLDGKKHSCCQICYKSEIQPLVNLEPMISSKKRSL